MPKAPVVLFAYKRPEHARQTLESLSKCEGAQESELFIYCDGPKGPQDEEAVREVRALAKSGRWCGEVHVIEREKNMGLANSIIGGVTEIVNRYGRIIVLEDDLVLSPQFLNYMNNALDKYENSKQVYSITGYSFTNDVQNIDETYFLKITGSWSWATWADRWRNFDIQASGWEDIRSNEQLKYKFDYDGSYKYFRMMESQKAGRIDSWAIKWYWSVFRQGGLTLYPSRALVKNIGFDGTGTHCGAISGDSVLFDVGPDIKLSDELFEKKEIRAMVSSVLKGTRPRENGRLVDRFKRILLKK